MPPPVLLELSSIDQGKLLMNREEILAALPHRHEFQLVDGVFQCDTTTGIFAGYHDVKPDGFWARGHIPGRPLFPGVLMIEVAAQLSSIMYHRYISEAGFLGFVGVDGVKFRGTVEPPCRLVVVGKAIQVKPRRTICHCQGFVGGDMVFEAEITGMPI